MIGRGMTIAVATESSFCKVPTMLSNSRQLIASLIVPLWLLAPNDVVAQTATPKPVSTTPELADGAAPVSSLRLALNRPFNMRALTDPAYLPQSTPARDSLKNGTIIGAVVGAVALGVFGGALCNALQEPGEPSCLKDTLRIAALGAAIGAGAGLAVDAARNQRGGVTLSMRFRF
jgi:hypothetical protein